MPKKSTKTVKFVPRFSLFIAGLHGRRLARRRWRLAETRFAHELRASEAPRSTTVGDAVVGGSTSGVAAAGAEHG